MPVVLCIHHINSYRHRLLCSSRCKYPILIHLYCHFRLNACCIVSSKCFITLTKDNLIFLPSLCFLLCPSLSLVRSPRPPRFGKVQSVKFLPSSGCGLSAAVAFTDIRSAEKAYNDDNKIEERLLKTDYYEPPASSTSQSAIFIHETREDALSVRRANSSSHNSSSSTTSTSASSASYGSTSGVSGSKFSHRREAPSSRG